VCAICVGLSPYCVRAGGVLWDCSGKRRATPLYYRSISSSREKRRRCSAMPAHSKKGFRLEYFQECCNRRTVGDARTSHREAAPGPNPQSYLKCSNTVPPASGRRFPGCESRRVLRPELRPVISRWRRPIFGKQPQKISSAAVA
jgi:hypothetical protein